MFSNKKVQLYKLFTIWLFASIIFSGYANAQNTKDTVAYKTIENAFKSGEMQKLSQLFNNKIDVTLPNQTGIYSSTQAYYILKEFFKSNKPRSFYIITENYNNGSNLIVGKMSTANENFRVCYLTKYSENRLLIYQIRIEK